MSEQLQGPGVTGIWELVRRSLRVMLTAAGYAIGFAALAQRLGTHMSLLQEWQIGLSFREKLRNRRRARQKSATASGENLRNRAWRSQEPRGDSTQKPRGDRS